VAASSAPAVAGDTGGSPGCQVHACEADDAAKEATEKLTKEDIETPTKATIIKLGCKEKVDELSGESDSSVESKEIDEIMGLLDGLYPAMAIKA